jgi:hypothetical protein
LALLPGVSAYPASEECKDADEVKFNWSWCVKNQESSSEIDQICYGDVFYQDMMFSSLKFVTKSADARCFFSYGEWQNKEVTGCDYAIERTYSTIYGDQILFPVTECTRNEVVVSVEGSFKEQKFKGILQ